MMKNLTARVTPAVSILVGLALAGAAWMQSGSPDGQSHPIGSLESSLNR